MLGEGRGVGGREESERGVNERRRMREREKETDARRRR